MELKRNDPLPLSLIGLILDVLFHAGAIKERNYHVYKDYFISGMALDDIAMKYDWKVSKVKRVLDTTRDSLSACQEKVKVFLTADWIQAIQILEKKNISSVEMLACVYKRHVSAIPIENLPLSVKAFTKLRTLKVSYASEIVQFSEAELLKRGFSQKIIDEIKEVLGKKMLELKK